MAEPRYVNFTSDYDAQLSAFARRQKLAELLAQQGGEDIKVESVNGIPTPISPFQGLANVLKSGMGAYLGGKASRDEEAATAAEKAAINEERDRIFARNPAVAATEASQGDDIDLEGNRNFIAATPGKAASYILDPEAQINALYTLGGRSSLGEKAADRYLPLAMRRLERADAEELYKRGRADKAADTVSDRDYEDRVRKEPPMGTPSEFERIAAQLKTLTGSENLADIELAKQLGARLNFLSTHQPTSSSNGGRPPSLSAAGHFRLGQNITADVTSQKQFEKYMNAATNGPVGLNLLAKQFIANITTAFGGQLTQDQVNLMSQPGQLQGLIGRARIPIIGGGVMTNQDAERVVTALGGDVNLWRNPDVVAKVIKTVMDAKRDEMQYNIDTYNRDAEYFRMPSMSNYNPGGDNAGGDNTNHPPDIQAILNAQGQR